MDRHPRKRVPMFLYMYERSGDGYVSLIIRFKELAEKMLIALSHGDRDLYPAQVEDETVVDTAKSLDAIAVDDILAVAPHKTEIDRKPFKILQSIANNMLHNLTVVVDINLHIIVGRLQKENIVEMQRADKPATLIIKGQDDILILRCAQA